MDFCDCTASEPNKDLEKSKINGKLHFLCSVKNGDTSYSLDCNLNCRKHKRNCSELKKHIMSSTIRLPIFKCTYFREFHKFFYQFVKTVTSEISQNHLLAKPNTHEKRSNNLSILIKVSDG